MRSALRCALVGGLRRVRWRYDAPRHERGGPGSRDARCALGFQDVRSPDFWDTSPKKEEQMGKIKLLLVLGVIFLSISVCLPVSTSNADVKDLGDVCISLSFDFTGFPPVTHTYGLLVYGASQQHILLTATGEPEHGFAILTGDKIIVTLNGTSVSDDSSIILFSTKQIILSASTLRGPFTAITTSPIPASQSIKRTGTAEVFRCN